MKLLLAILVLLASIRCYGQAVIVTASGACTDRQPPAYTTSTKRFDCTTLGYNDLTGTPPTTPVPLGTKSLTITLNNEGSTGTTAGLLAKVINDPPVVRNITTADTTGIIGICTTVTGSTSACGTTGTADIAVIGNVACQFDGATTANDFVIASTTSAGKCHDAGSTYPTGVAVLGTVLSTNVGAGTYAMNLQTPDVANTSNVSNGGGKGTSIQINGTAISKQIANFNATTPVAAVGFTNVTFQTSTSGNVNNISAEAPFVSVSSGLIGSNQRLTYGVHIGSGTQTLGVGASSVNCSGGTVTSKSPDATRPFPYQSWLTPSTINTICGEGYPVIHRWGQNQYFSIVAGLENTSNIRWWIGLTNQTHSTMSGSDDPAGHYAMFRASTGAGDTNFMCVTKDNSTQSAVSSGVAINTATHRFEFQADDSVPNIKFFIDSVLVCTFTSSQHLPASGTNMEFVRVIQNTASGVVGMDVADWVITQKYN